MVRKLLTFLAVMALGVLSTDTMEAIFDRMPQKHIRPLDVMYWAHPAYDSDYVVRQQRFHLEKAAEQLTEMMDMHGVPLEIVPGRMIERPLSERSTVPRDSQGRRVPGATLGHCAQLWWEHDPDHSTDDNMRNRLRFCSVPRAWPGLNQGWTAGVQGVASGRLFIVTEMSALDSGVGIFPYVGGSHSSLVHEAIHTLGCGHGQGLTTCENIDVPINLLMNGGCGHGVPRILAVNDPAKSYCVDNKCTTLAPRNGGDGCAAGIRRRLSTYVQQLFVKDCESGELDWRGYCVSRRNEECTSHTGIGQFVTLRQCMNFLEERPHKCRSGDVFRNGRSCRCCTQETAWEPRTGHKIFRSYVLDNVEHEVAVVNWAQRSKLNTPYESPVYDHVCDDCKCTGWRSDPRSMSFSECIIHAAGAARNYISYNPTTNSCITALTCTYDVDFKCEPAGKDEESKGWSTYRYEDFVEPGREFEPCGNQVHCSFNDVIRETEMLPGELSTWTFPRTGKSITERCSDFCGDLPFFALWSGGNRKCQCFAQCDNHNFRIGERARNLQNVVYERRLQWTVGEWSDCSVTCGDGIEIRNVQCANAHGCAGLAPASQRVCSRPSCPEPNSDLGFGCPAQFRSPGGFFNRKFDVTMEECQEHCVQAMGENCRGVIFHQSSDSQLGTCLSLGRNPFNNASVNRQNTWIVERGPGLFCETAEPENCPDC